VRARCTPPLLNWLEADEGGRTPATLIVFTVTWPLGSCRTVTCGYAATAQRGDTAARGVATERIVEPMSFAQADGVTAEHADDRMVVLGVDGQAMTTLNPIGALVWERLAEPADADDVVAHLVTYFPDVDLPVLQADVGRFLAAMRAAELIVEADVAR